MGKIDFSVARIKHRVWRTKLRAFLDGKKSMSETEALSHEDCDLGKWLYSEGMIKYGSILEMRKLAKAHVELHAAVRKIVELRKADKHDRSKKEYAKIEFLSDKLISLLLLLEQKH